MTREVKTDEEMEVIEAWWSNKPEVDKLLKRPIFGHWEDVTNWLIKRVKELRSERDSETRWAKQYFDLWEEAKAYIKELVREGKMDEIKLELAFKDQQFSGIVVGEHLIEDGEVVDYIKELERVEEFNDCMERIKELEENNEGLRDALNLRKGALVQATNGIKQLNERIKELEEGIEKIINYSSNYSAAMYLADMRDKLRKLVEKEGKMDEKITCNNLICYAEKVQFEARIKELEHVEEFTTKNIFFLQGELDKSKTRIEDLEGGIKKHKDKKYGLVERRTGKIIAYADFSDEDKELYRLIEKK